MDHITKVVLEVMAGAGVTVTHTQMPDGQYGVIATDPAKNETHVATGSDLYTAVCEAAQAVGFDLEDA